MPRQSELLIDLTHQIGYAETMELLRAWGGRRLRVPQTMEPEHPIALQIGFCAAGQLSYWYGGTRLELPAERNALLEVRNSNILRDLDKGVSVRSVADRYGMTPRHVRKIRASRPAEGGTITPS